MRFFRWTAAAIAAAVLAACGGGGDDDPPARGAVLNSLVLGQATTAQIDAGTAASGAQALTGAARCDVTIRYVQYSTRAPGGEAVRASAGVLVPGGSAPGCSGERPVLLYAHGTAANKSKNMSQVSSDSEASGLMAFYAAQGFIVVMPNYLGYDGSLAWHPFLNAKSQATDMIDALRASKSALASAGGTTASAALLISGYSEGGHVAMATHKEIQENYSDITVTASAPMSGPYNMVGTGDAVFVANTPLVGSLIFGPLLLTSYQNSYGNIYGSPSDAYQSPYDTTAPGIFPNALSVNDLIAAGKLPADPTLTLKLFGTGGLITDSFKAAYPTSNFRAALQQNTLLGWTPTRPMALCGGAQDPTIYFSVNASAAQADFASRGALVPAFDLENRASLPAGPLGDALYGGFQAQKAAAGANATAQYHGTLVPPFCLALSRGFFAQVLAAAAQ